MSRITITANQVHEWVLGLHRECQAEITSGERAEQHKYATLIQNPKDKIFLSKLLDESSQIRSNAKLAVRVKELIDQYGVPEFFSSSDTFLLRAYQWVGYRFDFVSIPIFKKRLRMDTAGVIIDQQRPILTRHLALRKSQNVGQNINLLGEVVVGNAEADARYHHYLDALKEEDINYISIKISGIYAQLHPLNFRKSREELITRIAAIYRQAIAYPYTEIRNGTTIKSAKFVNLDMEEYKDAHLTMDLFKSVLSMPEFKHYTAGIVIQAYLPDSWHLQGELLEFAKARVADGGAPVKMRLVKGANLQMESVVSSLRGWPNPVLGSKVEVDASYLRILDRALMPENIEALKVGVASHNLFSIGYAYLLSQHYGTSDGVTFEMLEGMAGQLWRAMRTLGNRVILYTPVVSDENFLNAVSYLVRRLDENTGPENFLSYSFNLKAGSTAWNYLQGQFDMAYSLKSEAAAEVPDAATGASNEAWCLPTRTQNRSINSADNKVSHYDDLSQYKFRNEPDTDFDLHVNKLWAESIVERWCSGSDVDRVIPVQIGENLVVNENRHTFIDRCQPLNDIVVYEMCKASTTQVKEIVNVAQCDASSWRHTSSEERQRILMRTADLLTERRGELIGVMCAVTGKTVTEGDVEVSEAIDFCRFYPYSYRRFAELPGVEITPQGAVLVIAPWNFPLAIPVGGVSSALSGGNNVILKPATVAAPVAWEFAKAFWDAGVPRNALQVVITDSREALSTLTGAPDIQHVIFTGGTDTAQSICQASPTTRFSGETGGKNAVILTELGDRDKAIMNVVASAFGNAGQKCSACSLFLVEKGIFNDPNFKRKLKDAVTSLAVGSVWELGNIVGPMIDSARNNAKLQRALVLDQGEEWLVEPRFIDQRQYIMAPTVKWGAAHDSFTVRNELFAPLLTVCSINSLAHGVDVVNSLDYGLTSGLQSLSEDEQRFWCNHIMAGNLYINRGITGAIVNRQPFGGMKLSAFGAGIKAGGPNYVSCLVNFKNTTSSTLPEILQNYEYAWTTEFSQGRDVNQLYGELNEFRYLPVRNMVLRVMEEDSMRDIEMVTIAAKICGVILTISIRESDPKYSQIQTLACKVIAQTPEAFIDGMMYWDRVRTLRTDIPTDIYKRASQLNLYIATAPPVTEGRVELLHYLREQSISYEYHRYGSIVEVPELF